MPKRRVKSSEEHVKQPYEKFLRSVRLVAMGLRDCRCSLDRASYFDVSEHKRGVTRVNAEHKLTKAGDGHFDTFGSISVTLEDAKKKMQVLSVFCSFEAHFHADFSVGSDFPERFANGELRLILFPYFREFVSNMTGRMAVRPVFIPLATDE